MSTLSISLTSNQVKLVDELTASHGFANRSEFFRAILRLVIKDPAIAKTASTYPFVSPVTKSAKRIVSDFKKTGRYSDTFLADLKTGLSESDYFTK